MLLTLNRTTLSGRTRFRSSIPQFLTLLALVFGIARSLPAQTWLTDVDRRLELRWPEKLPAGETLYGRLGVLEQLRLIVPENAVVFDDSGKVVVSKVILARNGRPELWFQAEPKHKYFVGWQTVAKVIAPAKTEAAPTGTDLKINEKVGDKPKEPSGKQPETPKAATGASKGKPKPTPPEIRHARPPGWSTTVTVVDVRPGEMISQAGLKTASGFVRVINVGKTAARFEISAHIHQPPWRIGPVVLGKQLVEPQQSSPWLWIESLDGVTAPFTLKINSRGPAVAAGRPRMKATEPPVEAIAGTVEFVRSLAGREGEYVRRFRLQNEPVVVEVQRLDYRDEADLRTPDEIGDELLDQVRKLKFAGKRPEKLPTGSPSGAAADLEAGRLLGFNAVSGSPQGFPAEAFRKFGYRYIFSDSHAIETREQGFGFKIPVVEAEMKKLADDWRRLDLADKVYLLNLFEDAALDIDGQIRKEQPVNLAIDPNAWRQMMGVAGLKPADFVVEDNPPPAGAAPDSPEYWEKLQAVHPRLGRDDPVGAMKSLRLLASIWPTRFRNGTEAAQRAFHRGVFTSAEIHGEQYFQHGLGGIDPWRMSRHQSLDIAKSRDDSALDPLEEEFLIDLQRSAQGTSQKPVFGSFTAQSGRPTPSPQSLELRGVGALGAGARGLSFSAWGPRWQADSKWFSDDVRRLEAIGRINHAAGWVEDILLDGRPAQGEVAILVSPLADLWDFMLRDREGVEVQAERRRLHRLFRSLHYQVDFLNDEYLPRDSELDRYRVIVVSQTCMTVGTAKRLEEWVNRGGTLIGSASIGQFDETGQSTASKAAKNEPSVEGLLSAFGIKSLSWRRATRRQVAATEAVTLEVTEPIRKIEVGSAEVIHKFNTGDVAVTRRKLGKGQLVFCGFGLGAVYHSGAHLEGDVFKGMQAAVRELVRPWLAGVGAPLCRTDHPLISARLIRSYHGNALFLVNLSGSPIKRVRATVRISGLQSAESLSQGKLTVERDRQDSRFELPLERTDVIRFK